MSLNADGWKVEKIEGVQKGSVRLITRGGEKKKVAIKTSQHASIGFNRNVEERYWFTLDGVEAVVMVSVDNNYRPDNVLVHMMNQGDVVKSFDNEYRLKPRSIVFTSLYGEPDEKILTMAGAGLGNRHPAFQKFPYSVLVDEEINSNEDRDVKGEPLSIHEAKKRLAATLGVSTESIKISVEA